MLAKRPYDGALKDTIEAAARDAGQPLIREHWLSFGSDALIALRRGYRAALIASFDEHKLPTNYHQPTDTADNVDLATVESAALVTRGDGRGGSREPDGARRGEPTSPAYCAAAISAQQLAEPRPGARCRARAPARRRARAAPGAPCSCQSSAGPSSSRDELEVLGDRLVGLAPARGQPVGDRQQVTSTSTARRRAGSGRPSRRSSGRWRTRKPGAGGGASGRRRGGAGARSRAGASRMSRATSAPSRSWPGKPKPPFGLGHARSAAWRCRAAARRSAAPPPRVSSSASGSAQQRARRAAPCSAPSTAAGSRSSVDRPLEHLERVAVHVEVVVDGLLDPAQRAELGQHGVQVARALGEQRARRRPRRRRRSAAARRRRARRHASQPGRSARARRAAVAARRARGRARTARRASRSTRSGSSANAARPDRAQPARGEVARRRRRGRSARRRRAARRSR